MQSARFYRVGTHLPRKKRNSEIYIGEHYVFVTKLNSQTIDPFRILVHWVLESNDKSFVEQSNNANDQNVLRFS